MIRLIAHRGSSHVAPENTLAAFRQAWEDGADGIEGDFRLTRDGCIVCMHDATTGRTADHDLRVDASTLAELAALDVGAWKDPAYAGERIATLEEVLATVPRGKLVYIEVKCGPELVAPLGQVLDAKGFDPAQMRVIAFDPRVIAATKELLPRVKAFWLTKYMQDKQTGVRTPSLDLVLKTLHESRADGLGTHADLNVVNARFVEKLRAANQEFHTWTVDDPAAAQKFVQLGIDSITTNRPKELRAALA